MIKKRKEWIAVVVVLLVALATQSVDAICGDGVLDVGELCDPVLHTCCAPNCLTVLLMGTTCRGSFGPCDLVEVCNGVNYTCPTNLFRPSTHVCRDVIPGSLCDLKEYCTGTSPLCPPDLAAPNTTLCRTQSPGMECVADAYCPGTLPSVDPNAKVCPPISYLGNATEPVVCRDEPNQCDIPEFCPEPGSNMAGAETPWACPLNINRGTLADHPLNVNLTGIAMCDIDGLACTQGQCNAMTGQCVEPAATGINCACGDKIDCILNKIESSSEGNRFNYVNEGQYPMSFGVLNQAFYNYYQGVYNSTAPTYLSAEFFMSYNRHYQSLFDGNFVDLRNDLSPGFNLDYSRNMYDWPEGSSASINALCTGGVCRKFNEAWAEDDWFGTYTFTTVGPYEGMAHCYVDGAHWFDPGQIDFLMDNIAGAGGWPDGGYVAVVPGAPDPRVGLSLATDIALFSTQPGSPCRGCVSDMTGNLITSWGDLSNNTVCLLPPEYQNLPCAKNPYFGTCQGGQCLPVPLVASVPTPCSTTSGGVCYDGEILCDSSPADVPLLMPGGPLYCELSAGNNSLLACSATKGNCGFDSYCGAGNAFCPSPVVLSQGTECRSPSGPCDAPEVCDGVSTECPPDLLYPAGISPIGEDARGPCEMIVACDGESANFAGGNTTMRVPKGPMYMCRAPVDLCEQPTFCPDPNEVAEWWLCPEPQLYNSTHVCRDNEGTCLLPSYCTGNSTACPPNQLAPNGTLCGSPDGLCEKPSYCDGIFPTCPPKQLYPAGTVCRPIDGTCDFEEQCDGMSVDCPEDVVASNTTICHISEGPCEDDVYCPGPFANVTNPGQCPPRDFFGNDTVCRMAEGLCDKEERCDPNSATPWLCPVDEVQPNTYECRGAAAPCDKPEFCDGFIKTCPTDQVQPNTFACHEPQGECEVAVYCNGITITCQSRQFLGSNVVCHVPEGPCDKQITCDPFSATPWLCPPTQFYGPELICAIPNGNCATPGYCNGTSPFCPGLTYLGNDTICRQATSQCDQAEYCVDGNEACPTNVRKPLGSPCMADALNCTVDVCDGFGNCNRESEFCECFFNNECPTNATCVIGTCLNGFCQQQLSQGFCFIDGTCVGEGANPDSNPCLSCQSSVNPYDWTPTVMGTPCNTGNPAGLCSAQDTCNGMGVCVDQYQPSTHICRQAAHSCDEPETCSGTDDYCTAPDLFKPPGTVCRNATGPCDAVEYCPAEGGPCPPDLALPSTTLCQAKRGQCEGDAYCRGTIPAQDPLAKECPTPLLLPGTAVCRPAIFICDEQETCNPNSATPWLCPVDAVKNTSQLCHIPTGPCDQPKYCDGVTKTCPAPMLFGPTHQCRVPAGSCEEPGFCTLGTDQCEPISYKPQGTICQPSGLLCASNAVCSGNSSFCPSLTPLSQGTQCFVPRGTCEGPGFCDGQSLQCQLEGLKSSGTVCRQSIDMNRCDPQEVCSGFDYACPPDAKRPDGFPCPDSLYCNGDETCLAGVCQPSPGPRNCSDGSPCTLDSCNEQTNQCVHVPLPGIGNVCYQGPMGTADVGICRSGTQRCNNTNGNLYCLGQVLPLPDEICGNGLDDDCNGVPDDACSGLTCVTDNDCISFIQYPCQNAACVNNFCQYPVHPGVCLIGGQCIMEGTISPTAPCLSCRSALSQTSYSPDPTIDPSDGNVCNGVEVCSFGNLVLMPGPLQCPHSPNSCLPFVCDPVLGCIQQPLPVNSTCTLPQGAICLGGNTTCNIDNQCVCDGDVQMRSKFGESPHEILWVPLIIGAAAFLVAACVCVVIPTSRRRREEREQELLGKQK